MTADVVHTLQVWLRRNSLCKYATFAGAVPFWAVFRITSVNGFEKVAKLARMLEIDSLRFLLWLKFEITGMQSLKKNS